MVLYEVEDRTIVIDFVVEDCIKSFHLLLNTLKPFIFVSWVVAEVIGVDLEIKMFKPYK